MTEYDQAGRYLIKCDAAGFCRWLLGRADVAFHLWIDSRRLALPDQRDRTNDLVASFRTASGFEALVIELQSEARAKVLDRLLEYLARLWSEPNTDRSLALTAAGAAVLNLTGAAQPGSLVLRPTVAPGCRLEMTVLQRTLRDEAAADLLGTVAAGTVSSWQLGWVPLMHGGAEPGIIESWRRITEHCHEEPRRNELGIIALTFAGLAGCRPLWERGLRRWTVQRSSLWGEIREEGRAVGREEGRQEARAEVIRETVLLLGRQRFGRTATARQQAQLAAVTDLARLERMRDRLLDAPSWTDLLATP
jgi:hypothetical protein